MLATIALQDGGGTIDYHELNAQLRQRAELASKLKAGAAGKIEIKAKNKHAIGTGRKVRARSKTLGSDFQLALGERPLLAQLCTALNAAWARVVDLFHEWDANGDGEISRREMHRAMAVLGLGGPATQAAAPAPAAPAKPPKVTSFAAAPAPALAAGPAPAPAAEPSTAGAMRAVDELFDLIDADGQGTIDIKELASAIRPSTLKHKSTAPIAAVCVPRPPFPRRGYRAQTSVLVQPPPPPTLDPFGALGGSTSAAGAAGHSSAASVSRVAGPPRLIDSQSEHEALAPAAALIGQSAHAHAASAAELPSYRCERPATVDPHAMVGRLSVSQSMPSLHRYPRATSAPPLRHKEPPVTISPYSVPKTRPAIDPFLSRPHAPCMRLGAAPLPLSGQHPPDSRLMRSPSTIRMLRSSDAQLAWFQSFTGESRRAAHGYSAVLPAPAYT